MGRMAQKNLTVAIAGFGTAARAHAEAFEDVGGFDLVAIYCPAFGAEAPRVREQFGDRIAVFDSYEGMLSTVKPDVVSICTMHDAHADQAIKAIEGGADLILEKPFVTEAQDLVRLSEAVKRTGAKVCAGFHEFHTGQFRAALDMIELGYLGNLHLTEVDYYGGIGPWAPQFWWARTEKQGGSSLLVAGCHALQFLLLCKADTPVVEVTSYATSTKAADFDEMEYEGAQVSLLKFADGTIGKVTSCIDSLQPYTFRSTLIGSEGSLIDRKFVTRKIAGLDLGQWSEIGARGLDDGDAVVGEMYAPMFRAFLADIRGEAALRFTDFATVFEMHRVLFAADQSAKQGRPVKLHEIEV